MAKSVDYDALLDRAFDNMPESVHEKERYEIPKARGHIEGKKTVISNFLKIVESLSRDKAHVMKFLLKELATPGELRRAELLLGAKIAASTFNSKVRKYAEEFVLCKTCGKPDTQIQKEGEVYFIKCQACGAKHHVKYRF